jgi:ribosomal protein S17
MQQIVTKTKQILALTMIATALSTAAMAQKPEATGGAVLTSEPGKAALVQTVSVSAQVIGIEKATRTVTLKGPKGDVVDVVAGDEVKNFNQIKLGDLVVVRYTEALTLELKKTAAASDNVTVREEVMKAKPGDKPAVAGARQVSALVEVVAVDPKASTIKVKTPKGNIETLNVQNPDQFKVVKKGDQIEVTYTEAIALSVEPAAKPGAAKKK